VTLQTDPVLFWVLHAAFALVFLRALYMDVVAGYRRRRSLLTEALGGDAIERFRFVVVQAVIAVLLLHVIDVAEGIDHKLAITVIDMATLAYLTFRSGWWLDRVTLGSRSRRRGERRR
jgi:hypothetical protein